MRQIYKGKYGWRTWWVSADNWLFWDRWTDMLPFKELEPKDKPQSEPKKHQAVKPADQDPSYSHVRYLRHHGRLAEKGISRDELNLRGKLVPPFPPVFPKELGL